jgi:putative sigma-54 modulation protein
MHTHITGRHLEITDDIRAYIERRAGKVEAIFKRIVDLQVVIELEKHRYSTEITLATRKATFHAEAETHDLFSSLDDVMNKVEEQIRRHKERLKDRRHRLARRDVAVQLSGDGEVVPLKSDTDDSADASLSLFSAPEKFATKPMTLEEAVMQLRISGDSLLLFLNAQTNQVNLVYEEDNGEYGWVEPQFA